MRIPTVFLPLRALGSLLFPCRMKVYGPGVCALISLNVSSENKVYCLACAMSLQISVSLGCFVGIFLIRQIFSTVFCCSGKHAKAYTESVG